MKYNRPIRWGIIGAGKIARKFVHDFSLTVGGELAGIASSDMDRAESFAREFCLPSALTYEELYTNDKIDIVYIATTHNTHFKHSAACLENKKAVLCEKPITVNPKECRQLQLIAKSERVFLMEGLWTYFLPSIIQAKEWILQGRIGGLKVIHANFGYSMEQNPASRLYDPLLAGGALLDLGIYPIAISTYFTNQFPVTIHASSTFSHTGVDENTGILLKYEGGISSVLFTSMVTKTVNSAFLYGEEGFIEIPDFFKAFSVRLFDKDYRLLETFQDDRQGFGYEFQIQHVMDCLLACSLESNVATHKISLQNQDIMMEARTQIGLVYPMEISA